MCETAGLMIEPDNLQQEQFFDSVCWFHLTSSGADSSTTDMRIGCEKLPLSPFHQTKNNENINRNEDDIKYLGRSSEQGQ